MQLLMVLKAGLLGRLLTPFSLWLGSIVARPTCESNTGITLGSSFSRFLLFPVDTGFFVSKLN